MFRGSDLLNARHGGAAASLPLNTWLATVRSRTLGEEVPLDQTSRVPFKYSYRSLVSHLPSIFTQSLGVAEFPGPSWKGRRLMGLPQQGLNRWPTTSKALSCKHIK